MPAAEYRLFRRVRGVFYQQDNETGAQVVEFTGRGMRPAWPRLWASANPPTR